MKATKPQPHRAAAPEPGPSAFAEWMRANVAREIKAGRVRSTVDDDGVEHAIN
ncbi:MULTISPECIES: hypothetical protein [Bradyrhizobium]|jgi:hypothetical protein|uniref:Uncharacterized protein n=2 Tax=Bradyrhizobium TaxID=374 RepID=A0ABY0PJV7_9BRAD|nr:MULTISPECIES: hypothetical protein [Bradyrhizobium]SDI54781.1 hypothetical protein SAMN05444163_3094 [Bradyrhizobium ottawaense]SED42632.1 hypothetical protein SAMN05444171_4075 [Bradyrhizobium lablabi]